MNTTNKMVRVTWATYIGPSNWQRNEQTCPSLAIALCVVAALKGRRNVKSVRYQGGGALSETV